MMLRKAVLGFLFGIWLALISGCLDAVAAPPVTYGRGITRVLDEGTLVSGSAGTLDCVGAGVTCTSNGNTVTITAGGGASGYTTVQEDGTPLTARAIINFGTGITASDDAGNSRTNVVLDQAVSPTWTGSHTFNTNPVTIGNSIRNLAGGTTAAPVYSFTGDTDTGFMATAANQLDFVTGGNGRMSITNGAVIPSVPFKPSVGGSAAGPQYTFNGDDDTGFFRDTANQVGFSAGGTERFRIDQWFRSKSHSAFAGSERYVLTGAVNTTNATQTTAATVTLTDNFVYYLEASCMGRDNAGSTERYYYRRATMAYRQGGGGATLGTIDTGFSDEPTLSTSDMTFTASSNDIRVSVTGQASTTITWACSVVYQGASTST